MPARILPEEPPPPDVTATQLLAAAVIEMAIRDAAKNRTAAHRGARAFLEGREGALHFWCTIAGLDPAHVIAAWQQFARAPDAATRVHSTRSLVERVTAGP